MERKNWIILEYDNYKDCLKKSKAFKENNGDA